MSFVTFLGDPLSFYAFFNPLFITFLGVSVFDATSEIFFCLIIGLIISLESRIFYLGGSGAMFYFN